MKIDINGEDYTVKNEDSLTYEEIVARAEYPGAVGVTVIYKHKDTKGILCSGESITPIEGIRIDAMFTGNA